MTLEFFARQKLGNFALDVSFASDSGVTALFGRSGSGKTSVIRIIAGLARPDQGRLVLNGDVLIDTEKNIFVPMHKRRFGYVFQDARLFPHLSVRQNLGYGNWFAPKAAKAQSFDRIVAMLGIQTLLDRAPGKLSGGEKQRVAIGRALLSSPRLLLMDEPLAALDEARKAEILPYLERLRDEFDIPIVYVSHSVPEVARLASHIVVMQQGRVAATGRASDVFSMPETAQSLDRRDVGALVDGIVSGHDQQHRLTTISIGRAELRVPLNGLQQGSAVRLHIPARDVMLATQRPLGLSALNIIEGRIGAIADAGDGMNDVQVECGGATIVARITSLSIETLQLSAGMPVFAIIKTASLQTA